MAVLGRVLVGSQERLDLSDFLSIDSYTAGDFKYLIQSFVGSGPMILKGFEVINAPASINGNSIAIEVADSVVYHSSQATGSFYYGLPAGNPLSTPLVPQLHLGTLLNPTTNYVYLTFTSSNEAQDVRAFWDVDLNGGTGGEFNQTVNTESVLTCQVGVSTSTFPDGTIPICTVTATTSITSITDCRNMMFRLGTGGSSPNPGNVYTFRSLPSTQYARVETPITITSSNQPNPFEGGDKNIYSLKEWMDVVMTKLLELSGTTYWYESAASLRLVDLYDDTSGSNIKSKGTWHHDGSTPGLITWSEDILYRKMNDPREIIIRSNVGGVTLADDHVLWIKIIRNQPLNVLNSSVNWVNGLNYVTGTIGSFANLGQGDWIKQYSDSDINYLRVEGFFAGPGLTNPTTAPSAAVVQLSANYAGSTTTGAGAYTKGVYLNTDVTISTRTDATAEAAGGNFYWLANRSDTIEALASIVPTMFTGSVNIVNSDGERAKVVFPSAHGLINGDRIVIAGTGTYDGTYQVEVQDITTVAITTSVTSNYTGATVSWSIVTTAARTSIGGLQLESANHNFENNQTIIIAGTGSLYDTYQGGLYQISNRSATTFQIPYNANTSVGPVSGATITCARVNLRTEFGSVKVIQGESIDINVPETQNILSYIGMDSLSQTNPIYDVPEGYNALVGFQDFNSDPDDSLTTRTSKLTAMMADRVQDRGLKLFGRLNFRNVGSGGNQIVSVSGDTLTVEKPGSSSNQTVTMPGSFTLAANQAVTVTLSREGSTAITPVIESINSPFLLAENKLILLYRLSDTSVYSWSGEQIVNSSSWTSNQYETAQNKNVFVQDLAGIHYNSVSQYFYYNSTADYVYINIHGSSYVNKIDPTAINALSNATRTVTDGQAVWLRINQAANKTFNIISNTATDQDSDAAGLLYITNINAVPTDPDVFVVYTVKGAALYTSAQHADPVGNVYEETATGVTTPVNSYQFTAPVSAPVIVNLPNDTRNNGLSRYYGVGSGTLTLFLNGQRLIMSNDWTEVGSIGSASNQVQIEQNLVLGDEITFRIDGFGGVYSSGGGGGSGTLQDAYDNGNTVAVTSGRPIVISGPPGQPLVHIAGDMQVDGLVDPTGVVLSRESSNPIPSGKDGLYVNSAGDLIQVRDSLVPPTLNITDTLINLNALYINGTNATGTTIAAGSVVAADTVTGQITLADASSLSNAQKTVGIVLNAITNSATGKVQITGLANIAPASFTVGQPVYLSTTPGLGMSSAPTAIGSARFSLGVAVSPTSVLLQPYLVKVNSNIYEEKNVLVSPIASSGTVTLPVDSRNSNLPASYIVGSGSLQVWLNGEKLFLGDDYSEIGVTGSSSNTITTLQNLVIGDKLVCRITT